MQEIEFPGPFYNSKELILASKSPRRQRLLASLGAHFRVLPSRSKEPGPESGQTPQEYCLEMARLKARSVKDVQIRGVILAADTIVVLGQEILGKPLDSFQALQTLRRLSGVSHEVLTACCFLESVSGLEKTFVVSTQVNMAPMQDEVLQCYVSRLKPLDKAGSYGIQDIGGALVQSIQGSYTNVVGLPLYETLQALLELGALTLEKDP